jgi:8-oxo-dGTP pyrophosphatase MutT (NUDIX family)
MNEKTPILNAATVLLLRDGSEGPEVLYLRRNAALNFHGGAWVYPGGRIDPDDFDNLETDDLDGAAKRAAVRETLEEASLEVDLSQLVPFAEWTTPPVRPKRFRTWFFAAKASERSEVRVDGGEIHEFRWMRPQEALLAQSRGEVELPAPTFVTSHWLQDFEYVSSALDALTRWPIPQYHPRLVKIDGGGVSLLSEDAGYESRDLDEKGEKHRVWMTEDGWRYERSQGIGPDRQSG